MKDDKIKEIIFQVSQATKNENSGLVQSLRESVAVLETHHIENREILERIEKQTTKTNGRVDTLEKDYGSLKMKLYIIGAIVLTILFLSGSEFVNFLKKIIR